VTPDTLHDPDNSPHPAHRRHSLLARIAAWAGGALVAIILIAAIAVTILLNSSRFHSYVIRTVQQQASDSLGVRVQLKNFAIHFSNLSLDLYGVTIDGASPYSNPPLLQADHLHAGVRIVSVLHRQWYLDSFKVDHPVVRVFVDAHGVSNIPTLKSSNSSGNTSVFDLGIRHASLEHGEVFYNNRPSTLSMNLSDVEFHSSFNIALKQYSGKLSYADGRLVYGAYEAVPHNFEAEFSATPTTFDLTRSRLTVGASQLNIAAVLNNYSAPSIQATYAATVDGSEVARVLHNASVPAGVLHTAGSIEYQQVANRALLDSVAVNGGLTSTRLDVRQPSARVTIGNLIAHYSLANGDATLRDLRATVLGGEVTAAGTMKNLSGKSQSNFTASLHNLSLADLKRTAGSAASQVNVALAGKLNAEAKASWGNTLDDLVVHTDATIEGGVQREPNGGHQAAAVALAANPQALPPDSLPIDSAIHATYTAKGSQLELKQSYLRTPQTNVTMNGTIGNHSSLELQLQANDLRELNTIADLFRTPAAGQAAQPLNLAGKASFHGTVQGSTSAPRLTGQLTASNLEFNGSAWKTLRTGVDVSPSRASFQNGELDPATRSKITFNASTALAKWSFTPDSEMEVDLHASQLNIADLTKLAGQQIPVTGTLSANIQAHGTELNPLGTGTVSLTGVTAYEQPVQALKVDFAGSGDEAHAHLTVQLPAGSVEGHVSVHPKQKTYVADLKAKDIRLDKLQALKAHNVDATGVLALDARGQGSFDNPAADVSLEIPKLVIEQQTISGLSLKMSVADHVANATLDSSAVYTTIKARAKVALTGDYLADASIDTQAIPLQPILAVYAPDEAAGVTGQTELHATLHGPLKNKNLLEAHVTIPMLSVDYNKTIQLAAAAPIHVDYKNGVIDLQRASIRGTDTDLQFQGTIPTAGNAPMSLLLLGTVDLKLAQLFDPDVTSSGQLKFNINSYGAAKGPNVGGTIDIVGAKFASADLPVGLDNGNGVLTLTRDRLEITKFQGTVGGGTVTAQGGVAYQPNVQFDLGLAAQGIRVLYPQGMREGIDAQIRLSGSLDNAVLGGTVNLSDLSFTPAFDLTSFLGQFSSSVATPPTAGFADNLQLNLAVHSTNNVSLVSRALSINGSANLRVRGTASNPVILGRVNLSGGDIILNGNRFLLNGGTVEFVNPMETEPVVNLTLNTNIQQYSIDLRFRGPVEQLHTEYSSNPSLPQADIIYLLAFGQTTEASGANPAAPANQEAESVLAGQVSSQVTSRLSRVAGISQLSISPVLAGSNSQGPPGANITIQQRVTGNLFITFSSNVASTQGQTIQGQYQVSPKVALSATRDPNGGFGFDTLIKRSW